MSGRPKVTTILFKSENRKQYAAFHSNTKFESLSLYVTETFHLNNFQMYFNNNLIANFQQTLTQVIGKAKGIIYIIPKDADNMQHQKILLSQYSDERLKTLNDDMNNNNIIMNTCSNINTIPNHNNLTEGNLNTNANMNTYPNKQTNKHYVETFKQIQDLRNENTMLQRRIEELEVQDENMKVLGAKNMKKLEPNNREIVIIKQQIEDVNKARIDIEKELKFINSKLERHLKEHQKKKQRHEPMKGFNKTTNNNKKQPITPVETIELIDMYNEGKYRRDCLLGTLEYLDLSSLFILSLINRDSCYITMEYLNHIMSYIQYESNIKMLNFVKSFTETIKEQPFVLSNETNSNLNAMCSSDFINNQENLFSLENTKLLSQKNIIKIYRILFQLTNEIQSSKFPTDKAYFSHMLDFIQTKSSSEYSFGEYMSNAVIAFDLSFPNFLRINEIVCKYISNSYDIKAIASQSKITGVVALVIEDVLQYLGIKSHNTLYHIYNDYKAEKRTNDNYKKILKLFRGRLLEL